MILFKIGFHCFIIILALAHKSHLFSQTEKKKENLDLVETAANFDLDDFLSGFGVFWEYRN